MSRPSVTGRRRPAPMNSGSPTHPLSTPGTAFADEVHRVRTGRATAAEAAAALVGQLSDDELLWALDGDVPQGAGMLQMFKRYNGVPMVAGQIDRLGIPGVRFTDGPRGVVMGNSTAFPASVARAATWDVEVEKQVGDAIGAEARAQGANLFAGVCINVPPFPGWGRSQEAYGEEPLLTGAMGEALITGVQPWVMACVKHYALNSMEESRFSADIEVDENVMHEAYLPHFRRAVESGADAVMSAYNSVNGEWAGQSRHLLTEILRQDWGFEGLVMTDFVWGLRDPIGSVAAGQDIEMPFRQQRARALPDALADGRLPREAVTTAATRIIASQIRLAVRALPDPDPAVVASPAHRALAREVARRGAVLLRNKPIGGVPVLPLSETRLGTVAVTGKLATTPNLGDNGSSRVRPPSESSILAGLHERLGDRAVYVPNVSATPAGVSSADVAIVVVGMGAADEGESMASADANSFAVFGGVFRSKLLQRMGAAAGSAALKALEFGGDRRDLHLTAEDVALIEQVAALNPRTVVVLIGGSTIMPDPWDQSVAAILLAWYPGMEGGRAIADVLLGDAEPSGRLPFAIPVTQTDLPVTSWRAKSVRYPRWFGQQRLDRNDVAAAYPLGYGQGYTTFRIESLSSPEQNDAEQLTVDVQVSNTGTRAGRHVVQIYAAQQTDPTLPRRALIGFAPVQLEAGESAVVTINSSLRPLQQWLDGHFTGPSGYWQIEASSFAGDPLAITTTINIPEHRIGPHEQSHAPESANRS